MFLLYMCVYYTYNNLKRTKTIPDAKPIQKWAENVADNTTKIENVPVYVSDYNCTQAGTCENPTAKCGTVTATIFQQQFITCYPDEQSDVIHLILFNSLIIYIKSK